MRTQAGSLGAGSGDSSSGGARLKVVVVAPPGLRPEDITLKVIDLDEGTTGLARLGPELLALLADLKQAGCSEAHIKEALAEQCMRSLSRAAPAETDAISYAARPEFVQLLARIDAARDADGIPTDKSLISAFILRFSEILLDHPLSPLLAVSMNAIIGALAKPDMADNIRTQLSELTWECYEALRVAKARNAANRAKRRRKRSWN